MHASLKECPNCHNPMESGYLWGTRGLLWKQARQVGQEWKFSNWQPNERVHNGWKIPLCYRCAACDIYWFVKNQDLAVKPLRDDSASST